MIGMLFAKTAGRHRRQHYTSQYNSATLLYKLHTIFQQTHYNAANCFMTDCRL